jgi:hypothetical protein
VRDDPDWPGLSPSVDERSLGGEGEIPAAAYRYQEAQELSRRSLEAQMAAEVRHQVAAFMERRGLGGLIRGGR